ncbi:MAG: hypothetical protein ACPKPY_08695 [Nitrososphaeraceae archaeon]
MVSTTIIEPIYAENEYSVHQFLKLFGWIAIFIGLLANVPFILYIKIKKLSVRKIGSSDPITRDMLVVHKPVLNYHIVLNIIAFCIAMIHFLGFINRIDPVSISIALVIIVLTLSGFLLRFIKFRNVQFFTRIIHTQIIMLILLVVLIIIHIVLEF